MDRRREILVSPGEEKTDAALREIARQEGVEITYKMRLADALDIENSGISSEEYTFALRSHLDFVVYRNNKIDFAVEFDGKQHQHKDGVRRDKLKDAVCQKLGMPLLRIDASMFRDVPGRMPWLHYIVRSFYMEQAFVEMQDQGAIPEDELFIPWGQLELVEGRGVRSIDPGLFWRSWLEARGREGKVANGGPLSLTAETDDGYVHAVALIALGQIEGFVMGRARVRKYRGFPVHDCELVDDLAVADAALKIRQVVAGNMTVLCTQKDAQRTLDWMKARRVLTCSGGGGGLPVRLQLTIDALSGKPK